MSDCHDKSYGRSTLAKRSILLRNAIVVLQTRHEVKDVRMVPLPQLADGPFGFVLRTVVSFVALLFDDEDPTVLIWSE
jgi:hypothetical protein